MNQNNYIIDTDPGVDDALAILFAVASGMNIPGLVATYGNASIEDTTRNALTVLELLNAGIPVYKGATTPLLGKPYYATVHGTNGLGGFEKKLTSKLNDLSAKQFYEGRINTSVICLGPTTTIASLVKVKFDTLIILGGVIGEKGNVTPYAEFNVYNDPLALKKTLEFTCQKVLIPINVCRKVMFSKEDFNQITNSTLRKNIQAITDLYISYYLSNTKHGGFSGGVMYDLLATAYPLYPELFTTKETFIEVEIEENERFGETREITNTSPNCMLVTDVNSEKLKEVFFETVNAWKR